MHMIDAVFWWTGAAIAIAACVSVAGLIICCAAMLMKKACVMLLERTLEIYRLESLKYYFRVMVENGRSGLLKEVAKSSEESKQQVRP